MATSVTRQCPTPWLASGQNVHAQWPAAVQDERLAGNRACLPDDSKQVTSSDPCVQLRVEMDARAAMCDMLARNMDAAHLEAEQLLAQQVHTLPMLACE